MSIGYHLRLAVPRIRTPGGVVDVFTHCIRDDIWGVTWMVAIPACPAASEGSSHPEDLPAPAKAVSMPLRLTVRGDRSSVHRSAWLRAEVLQNSYAERLIRAHKEKGGESI